MLSPILMFLTVTVLVSDSPDTVESWRERFYSRHRVFFSLFSVMLLAALLRQFAVLGSPLPSPGIGPPIILGLLGVLFGAIGAFSGKERLHQILAPITAATVLVFYATR